MTETMTDTVAAAAPRVAVPVTELPIAGIIRLADLHQPDNAALDTLVYLESVNREAGTMGIYTLNDNGETDTYMTRLSVNRALEVVHRDYYAWQRATKLTRAIGQVASINHSSLSAELQAKMTLAGQEFQRYYTFAEILKIEDGRVTARIFSTKSVTPDAIEYGEMTVPVTALENLSPMSFTRWERSYGLTKDVWPAGSFQYYSGELYEVLANKGYMSDFIRVDEATGERLATDKVTMSREYMTDIITAAPDKATYIGTLPTPEVVEAINLLSRNTVTRALKHADKNDYCSETAVALTSAGHAMPELRIKGTITLNVDISSKEYMLMRRLFGMTNADVTDVRDVFKARYSELAKHVKGLPAFTPDGNTVWDLSAEVEFKTPKLRPLA